MKINSDDIVLFESTGRQEYANGGIIGIAGGWPYGGYDSELLDPFRLTPEERNELSEFMIKQWKEFQLIDLTTNPK